MSKKQTPRATRPARRKARTWKPSGSYTARSITSDTGPSWWYAERKGLLVVAQLVSGAGGYVGTIQALVPWAAIRRAQPPARRGREKKP